MRTGSQKTPDLPFSQSAQPLPFVACDTDPRLLTQRRDCGQNRDETELQDAFE